MRLFMACMVYLLLHMLTGVHCYTETQETLRGDITLDIIKLLPVYMKRMLKVSCCCSVIYCVESCGDARLFVAFSQASFDGVVSDLNARENLSITEDH